MDRSNDAMTHVTTAEIASFEQQFKSHYVHLCTIAYYVVDDRDAARDIVQDFYLDFWNRRHKIVILQDFKSYASGAIRYLAINYLKKAGRIRLEEIPVMEELAAGFPSEDKQAREARYAAVWEVLSRLPEQRRKIFLMSNQQNIKYKDIAATLGISVNTVKTQIRLALQFLREECKWLTVPATVIWACLGQGFNF
ncbi:sigma-70 family RNA polymerase sigma factor [Chitinophaga sp.]|uniref:sigma-70 family RNA polymerase sigma factor n=1 Tax=Chitinophaga sp. TaxID=1869181 RepID=UPI0026174240|nr:sigma-70 family RNA polymerase sigma factor [uncultured Chitinophaga sp.]